MKLHLPHVETIKRTLRASLWVWVPLVAILVWRVSSLASQTMAVETENLQQEQLRAVTEASGAITGRLVWAQRDIRLLANLPSLKRYIAHPVAQNRQELTDSMVNFMASRSGVYAQVRYLDRTGQEIVRVDTVQGLPSVTPERLLQKKADRYYFTATQSLPDNTSFLSQFDLNVENGVVKVPYTPTLRVSTRVFGAASADAGIVIINYLGQPILDRMQAVSGIQKSQQSLWFVTSQGDWMVGPDPRDEWGFMFPEREANTMAKQFPEVWRFISTSAASTDVVTGHLPAGAFTAKRYAPSQQLSTEGYPLQTDPKTAWYLVVWYSQQELDDLLSPYVNDSLLNFAGLFALICAVSVVIGYGIHRRLLAEDATRLTNTSLQLANRELEAFSYSVSHDLRTPLRSVDGFSKILLQSYADHLDDTAKDYLRRMRDAAQRMGTMIDDILELSRISRINLKRTVVDLSAIAQLVMQELRSADPGREVEVRIAPGLLAFADDRLVRIAFANLLGNAWKFTSQTDRARIELGRTTHNGVAAFFVRDNGAGFDMAYAEKLYSAFQRLHQASEFPGTGIGLATVQRVVHKLGGAIWAEGAVGLGATFYFTLSPSPHSGEPR
jgi:signal transduction histidine kinase